MTTHGYYNGCHKWLRYNYGKASCCESTICPGNSKTYHWARKKGKEHARNRSHYKQLCEPCHKKYDAVKSAAEKPVFVGFRLYKMHRRIVSGVAKRRRMKQAEVIRDMIEAYAHNYKV